MAKRSSCCRASESRSARPVNPEPQLQPVPNSLTSVAITFPVRLLAKSRAERYDIVVVDTAPQADQAALRAARAADLVIVPLRPSIVDLDAIQTTMDICSLAKKTPLFVLNAISPHGREAAEVREVIGQRGGLMAAASLGDRKAFRIAFNDGQGAHEIDPRSKASAEIIALLAELNVPTLTRFGKTTRKKSAAWTRKHSHL